MRGISFAVEQGELFGLLGPNGAGKTTTIKMLITLLLPTSGQARVLGLDVVEHAPRGAEADRLRLRRRPRALRAALRRYDNLRYFAELYGVSGQGAEAADRRGARARRPEGPRAGARRGLLARHAPAAAHRPRASSTTPRSSSSTSRRSASTRSARASCARPSPGWSQAGKTVLLTTHYMFEADALCDRIAVIAQGPDRRRRARRGAQGRRRPNGTVIEIEVFGVDDANRRPAARRSRRDVGVGRGPRPDAGARRAVGARAAS